MKRLLAILLPALIGGLFLAPLPAQATTIIDGGGQIIDGHCAAASNIVVLRDDVTYRNFTLKNVTDANIVIAGFDHVTIENMVIQNWNCTDQPDHNHAGIKCNFCKHLIVRNNILSAPRNHGDGVYVLSNDTTISGGGHGIINNDITGGWDGIGGDEEFANHGGFDTNTEISGNWVTDCMDDGIQAEGGGNKVIVAYNDITGCGAAIAFAAPRTGPLAVMWNNIHNLKTGELNARYCFKVGTTPAATTYLRRNACRVNSQAEINAGGFDGISQTNDGLGPIISRRNIFNTSRFIFEEYEIMRPVGESYDKDCMGTTHPSYFIRWGTPIYSSLNAFRAVVLGQEVGGIQASYCTTNDDWQMPPVCPDYTGDGLVNVNDTLNFLAPISRYDSANYDPRWDRNQDGFITSADLQGWPAAGTNCD